MTFELILFPSTRRYCCLSLQARTTWLWASRASFDLEKCLVGRYFCFASLDHSLRAKHLTQNACWRAAISTATHRNGVKCTRGQKSTAQGAGESVRGQAHPARVPQGAWLCGHRTPEGPGATPKAKWAQHGSAKARPFSRPWSRGARLF
jgi:hypothetical protein